MQAFLLSTTLVTSAFADTITMWTMEANSQTEWQHKKRWQLLLTQKTGHTVNVVAVTEKDIATRATAAFAAGELPDILNHTVQHLLPFAEAGILDAGAADDIVNDLGSNTFASGPVNMASVEEIVSVPTDGWTQLVVYRSDLFAEAGLNPAKNFC